MENGESINQGEMFRSEKDVIKSRFEQSNTSRLTEYVTGLRIEDPKLIEKLENDQLAIREKYKLPKREDRFDNPQNYENYLRKIAEENGIKVVSKEEYTTEYDKDFFENSFLAGAVYDNDHKVIAVDIDNSDENSYLKSLINFEHETIHSLQDKNSPNMEIEQQEYEAYVANWNIDYLKRNTDAIGTVFDFAVGGSVNNWYREENKKNEEDVKPKWSDPEYFLKNVDRISQKKIENYKNESLGFVWFSVK